MSEVQSHAGPRERPRPLALPPPPQVLGRFSHEDREMLTRMLAEPFEFITHPSFHDEPTAKALFGEAAEMVSAPRAWCNVASDDVACHAAASEGVTLTGAEEQRLFLRLNYARYRIAKIFEQVGARPLSANATAELLTWRARSESARVALVHANMPLVLAMAKRARLGNIDYAELISEGNMALLRSVDKFDCNRGYKFSTYACRAILKSFSRVAIRTSRYRCRFPAEFDPSLERSDHLDRSRDQMETNCISELKDIIQRNLAELTEVELRVVTARFALDAPTDAEPAPPKTLEQVGLMIGVTKERVRQIQNKALAKLRAALEESILAA